MKRYTAPETEILLLQDSVATTLTSNPNELPIQGFDPDDPALNMDSREYNEDYARSLGLTR